MSQPTRHNKKAMPADGDHRIKGQWLPTTKKEMDHLGWEQADVILFSGDAYIDHPSMGAVVIRRAARNLNRLVIMYADHITESMQQTVDETERRRSLQLK